MARKFGPALVTFPNQVEVFARGLRRQLPGDPSPQFGLYALGEPLDRPSLSSRIFGIRPFVPTWPHTRIDWPDFGIPSDHEHAVSAIVHAFGLAAKGQRVEVACAGGVGRTGTVIACMAILSGEHVVEAIDWVRSNYRSDAVETAKQAVWIERFNESVR